MLPNRNSPPEAGKLSTPSSCRVAQTFKILLRPLPFADLPALTTVATTWHAPPSVFGNSSPLDGQGCHASWSPRFSPRHQPPFSKLINGDPLQTCLHQQVQFMPTPDRQKRFTVNPKEPAIDRVTAAGGVQLSIRGTTHPMTRVLAHGPRSGASAFSISAQPFGPCIVSQNPLPLPRPRTSASSERALILFPINPPLDDSRLVLRVYTSPSRGS